MTHDTNDRTASFRPSDFDTFLAEHQERACRVTAPRPGNKQALFGALAAAGIATVEVSFDGVGDEGQIESITTYGRDAGARTELPVTTVAFRSPSEGSTTSVEPLTVSQVLERLVYELLEETHPGWANDEGAFGRFTFDVATQRIRLEHHARIAETIDSTHEF